MFVDVATTPPGYTALALRKYSTFGIENCFGKVFLLVLMLC